jgi:hypothetical protein
MKTKQFCSLLAIFSAILLSACGKVPSKYRGNFVDATTGARLTLDKRGGTLTLASGRSVSAKAVSVDFESIAQGKPGIYTTLDEQDPNYLKMYWIFPDLSTRKENNGFVWTSAEILWTRISMNADQNVNEVWLQYCDSTVGYVEVDLTQKLWNGGCPAGAMVLDMRRVDSK